MTRLDAGAFHGQDGGLDLLEVSDLGGFAGAGEGGGFTVGDVDLEVARDRGWKDAEIGAGIDYGVNDDPLVAILKKQGDDGAFQFETI